MKRNFTILLFMCVLLLSGKSFAQCTVSITGDTLVCAGDQTMLTANAYGTGSQLMASNTAGNNHRGNMFDIVATNDVTILSFDASPMGNTTMEIYYKAGTWNGFANTPSAWTFLGSAPVTYTGGFVAVPIEVNVTIPAGQTYAFYVTSAVTGGTALNYSNGNAVGNVYSSDANITFLEGGGMEYPFTQGTGAVFQPRVWNGMIHYAMANVPGTTISWNTSETTNLIQPTINTMTTYNVEATIPGCPSTLYDTISVWTSVPPVSAGADQVHCMGDDVLLYGEGAETYAWDNGVTDSVAFVSSISGTTTYTVTGTDTMGCMVSATVDVLINDLPPVNAGEDFDACFGDEITLSGEGADTYSWNNGIDDNTAFEAINSATYILTGTDVNNCVQTDTVVVTVNTLPYVYGGGDQQACFGMEFTLSGSGADTYDWTNGVTDGVPYIVPMGVNEYIVTGTDVNGCSSTDTVTVTALNNQALIANVGTTLITSMEIGNTIEWYNCDNGQVISGETGFTYAPTVAGHYAAIVTNINQCVDTSDCVLIEFAGIKENSATAFQVYPNPTTGAVTIASSEGMISNIQVLDLVGKVIYEEQMNGMQTSLDLSRFEGKQFLVNIYSGDHKETVKVLKF